MFKEDSLGNYRIEFELFWHELELWQAILENATPETAFSLYQQKQSKEFSSYLWQAFLPKPSPALFLQQGSSRVADTISAPLVKQFKLPLSGVKIALDPGHFAEDISMARLEHRVIEIPAKKHPNSSVDIAFYEAQLTLQTALLLKVKLEAQGAQVLFSREPDGYNAFGISWYAWKANLKEHCATALATGEISKEEADFYVNEATDTELMRYFSKIERLERARIINAWQPDLTTIIHYNVDAENKPRNQTTERNFNMVFVGGSFLPNELKSIEDRFQFMRLLVSSDLVKSTILAEETIKAYNEQLQVPVVEPESEFYLRDYCMYVSEGLFARNLLLTNRIHGPLVYGETFCQDNVEESIALADPEGKRVEQVATAYYEAILNYYKRIELEE